MARSWSFPPFRLDVGTGSLWRDDALVPLPPKPFAVLAALVAHAGQVVTKETLFAAAWPETAVTDGVLKGCIRQIRRALGERGKTAQYIATVHRRGYRFCAPVTPVEAPPLTYAHRPRRASWGGRRSWPSTLSGGGTRRGPCSIYGRPRRPPASAVPTGKRSGHIQQPRRKAF